MDALEILWHMHREAEDSFQKIEDAEAGQRGGLWAKLRPELEMHEQMEEQFVYDPVHNDCGSDSMLMAWHEEHHTQVEEATRLIHMIGGLEPRDEMWLNHVMELRLMLARHIQREEHDIWPHIKQVWGQENLDRQAGPMQAMKAVGNAGSNISGMMGAAGEMLKGD